MKSCVIVCTVDKWIIKIQIIDCVKNKIGKEICYTGKNA